LYHVIIISAEEAAIKKPGAMPGNPVRWDTVEGEGAGL